ncbi:MAG: hypothetical protein QOG72_1121 [Sphingomonadales bacterium]|nr:hypothetical protein [Sphingomonadales bacterium]
MEPPPSVLAKALAALAGGALAFALTAGGLILMAGRAFEGWVFLACFAAVPAALIALLPFSARFFCFGLGLLAWAGTWLLDARGPDNPIIIFPWIASCFAGAVVVAELCVRAVALSRRHDSHAEAEL